MGYFDQRQQQPFNFNVDQNGLLELANVADPSIVMHYLDNHAKKTTPPYGDQLPQWATPAPDQTAQNVFGANPQSEPPKEIPIPKEPTPGIGLGIQGLSLLNQMSQQPQRMQAPSVGFAPRSAPIQFAPFQTPASKRPDLASIIYGGRR